MAAFNRFNCFTEDLSKKLHNLATDSLKVYLTNTAPVVTNTVYNTPADLATGGGYTAGGAAATITSCAQTAGVTKLVLADVIFTATTGFGPFRYAVLYNDTAVGKNLIGWWDNATPTSLGAGEVFTWDADPATGVLTVG